MKRLILILAMAMMTAAPLLARNYFNTYSAAYNVDLEDPDRYHVGTDDGVFDESGGPGYSNRTLIAQLGFADTSSPITIEITFDNTSWMYQSANQPNLRRPFGLDVVVRQRWYYNLCNNNNDGTTDETVAVYHYGLQPGGDSSAFVSIPYHDSTDGSVSKAGHELPGNHSWFFGCAGIQHDLIGAWIELVLVLPEIDPYDTSYTVGSADDYYASFDMTISGGGEAGTYHCEFTGYYDDPRDEEINFTLNVVPTANASAINLDSSPDIAPGDPGLQIGRYYYSTTKTTSSEDRNYFAFCSSSEIPDRNGGPFRLVRRGTYGGDLNEIWFEIGLQSSDPSKGVQWFAGSDVMSKGDMEPENVFYSSRRQDMQDIGGAAIYQRYDEGDILFRLAPGEDPGPLNAGVYTSYIYFHVVVEV